MIICPSCNHQNPEGSLQCENCYTPLLATTSCPNCGASVQTDATFCGQCGFNLQTHNPSTAASIEETAVDSLPNMNSEEVSLPDEIPLSQASPDILPETAMSSFIRSPWDEDEGEQTMAQTQPFPQGLPKIDSTEVINVVPSVSETESAGEEEVSPDEDITTPWESDFSDPHLEPKPTQAASELQGQGDAEFNNAIESTVEGGQKASVSKPDPEMMVSVGEATQLQIQTASLLHLQSNTTIEIPSNLDIVHIGKPNSQIPPDIDVAGFPDSEVVSRVHADIRIEGDAYFIEDMGSSNGTYINHAPLLRGNRHRLRPGDRVALGKGDLVTFIFQLD